MDENIRELDSEKQKLDADLEKLKKELDAESNTGIPDYGLNEDGSRKMPYFYGGMMQNEEARI